MDEELRDLLLRSMSDGQRRGAIRISEDGEQVEIDGLDGPVQRRLRPLGDLYGSGTGAASVDLADERFQPLGIAIEGAIVRYKDERRDLTDGQVLLSLNQLAMNPEADLSSAAADDLARYLQNELRLALSINNYSREDVRHTIRKIVKSVQRHNRLAGRRGYLQFIREFFPE